MKKTITIEFNEVCQSCNGTGLYVGMAERDGAAVVCHDCRGTGCHKFHHKYEEFVIRKERSGVERVFQTNPGICIGRGNGHRLADFGGMPLKEWEQGLPFVAGTENRKFTCPCWWYQSADYDRKPEWKECEDMLGRTFSGCPHFGKKAECWARWDKENS